MRKKAFLLLFLLITLMPVFPKTSYEATIRGEGMFTSVFAPADQMRSSPTFGVELDVLALKFAERHVLSLPVYVGYTYPTRRNGNVRLQEHVDMALTLSYRYKVNDFFHFSIKGGFGIDYYSAIKGIVGKVVGECALWFLPTDWLSFTFPARVSYGSGVYYLSYGIGLSVLIGNKGVEN